MKRLVYVFLSVVVIFIMMTQIQARDVEVIRAGPDDFCFVKHGMVRCYGRNKDARFGVGMNQPVGKSPETYGDAFQLPDFGIEYKKNETVKDVCISLEGLCVLTSNDRVRCVGHGKPDFQAGILGWGLSTADTNKIFDIYWYFGERGVVVVERDLTNQWWVGSIENCGAHSIPDTVLPDNLGVKPVKFICGNSNVGLIYEDGTVLGWGENFAMGIWAPYTPCGFGCGPTQVGFYGSPGTMGNLMPTSRLANLKFKHYQFVERFSCGLHFNSSIHCYAQWKPYGTLFGGSNFQVNGYVRGLPVGKTIDHIAVSGYFVTKFDVSGGAAQISQTQYPGPMGGAVTNDGDLYVWGSNALGSLGIGTTYADFNYFDNATKVDLIKPVKKVVMSQYTIRTCVIFTDGTLSCWGWNEAGELGFNAPLQSVWGSKPEHMGANLPLIDLGINKTVIDVALGHKFTCALLADDTIKCWGSNEYGVLGPTIGTAAGVSGTGMGESLPIVDTTMTVVHQMSSLQYHTCALFTTKGAIIDNVSNPPLVKCWGANYGGQIGFPAGNPPALGDASFQMGNKLKPMYFGPNKIPKQVKTAHGLHFVSGGTTKVWSVTGVSFTDGTMKLISDFTIRTNDYNGAPYYASGYGNHTDQYFPPDRPAFIDLGTSFEVNRISIGSDCYCAASTLQVKCWGFGGCFPHGYPLDIGARNGTMGNNLSPILDLTGSGVTIKDMVSNGNGFAFLLSNDSILLIGSNNGGELLQGNIQSNSVANRRAPVEAKLPSNLGIKSIFGYESSYCIVVDEKWITENRTNVMCWGPYHPNFPSALGVNAVGGSEATLNQTWVRISGNASVVAVNPGRYFCVQFKNGSVSCMTTALQDDFSRPLRFNEPLGSDGKTTPVDLGFHCNMKEMFQGRSPCGICSNRPICWGYGQFGRLGIGSDQNLILQLHQTPKIIVLSECEAGMFAPTSQGYCTACPRGSFREISTGAPKDSTSCTSCPVGKFGQVIGARSEALGCTECPVGKVSASPGSTTCIDCVPGKYAGTAGKSICTDCWPGSFAPVPGQANCTLCNVGEFNNGQGLTGCSDCDAGQFQSLPGQTGCSGCLKGKFQQDVGRGNCSDCAKGFFNSQTSQRQCSPCAAGSFSNGTGLTDCFACEAGSFQPSAGASTCEPCREGTVSTTSNAQECTTCAGGTYAPAGSSECMQCNAGTFSAVGSVNCSTCPVGFTSAARSQSCTACAAGSFNNATGMTECFACQPGSFQGSAGASTCRACAVGYVTSSPNAQECTPCGRGSYSDVVGASSCSGCLKGSFSSGTGSSTCERCPVGFFSASDGAQECVKCGAGTAASVTGSTSCVACVAGKFSPSGAANCTVCPSGSFQAAAGQSECLRCPVSTYAFAGASACSACPRGANCSSGVYNGPLPGFWHGAVGGGKQIPGQFYECPFVGSCQVNNNSLVCEVGYTGALCAECQPGYHLASGGCVACAGETNTITTAIGILVLIVSMCVMIFAIYRAFNNVDTAVQKNVETGQAPEAQSASIVQRLKAMNKIKVMVSFGQVLTSFNVTMEIPWPTQLKEFFAYFSSLNFNIFDVFAIDCAVRQNFFGNLVTVTAAPIVLALIAFVLYRVLKPRLDRKVEDTTLSPQLRIRVQRSLANKFIKGGLFLLFLVYPGVSSTILRTFDCKNVEGRMLLTSDYSISCEDDTYTLWSIYAAVFTLIYPIGIPLAFFIILFRNRQNLTDPDFKARFGFLYDAYEPQAWYYELTELIRKLALTGALIFIAPGSASQVSVALLICFLAVVLHANLQPFVEDVDDNLQTAALTQLFICLFAGLTLKTGISTTDGYDEPLLTGLLIILNSAVFILGMLAIAVTILCSAKRAFTHKSHHEEEDDDGKDRMEMKEMKKDVKDKDEDDEDDDEEEEEEEDKEQKEE